MPLLRRAEPFSDADWLFEINCDGFRAVAHEDGRCRLVSRNEFKSFQPLNTSLCFPRRTTFEHFTAGFTPKIRNGKQSQSATY
jgi:hypothetical protein